MRKLSVLFMFTVLVVSACASKDEGRTVVSPDYDMEADCLNGTMIVSLDGKYGLADTSGKEILPTAYDDVYYISDEVAVAFTGQTVGFFDRNGKRLGETMVEGEADVDGLLEAYSKIELARRELWDSILADYEQLRRYCQSDNASAGTANLMADGIRTSLQRVGGPMEKDQKVRFETDVHHTDIRIDEKTAYNIGHSVLRSGVRAEHRKHKERQFVHLRRGGGDDRNHG